MTDTKRKTGPRRSRFHLHADGEEFPNGRIYGEGNVFVSQSREVIDLQVNSGSVLITPHEAALIAQELFGLAHEIAEAD